MFNVLGTLAFRHKWSVVLGAVVFLLLSLALLLRGGKLGAPNISGLEADEGQHIVDQITGRPEAMTVIAVFRSAELAPTDPAFREAMHAALAEARKDPRVATIVTPDDAPTFLIDRLRNPKSRAALALITFKGDLQDAMDAYPPIRGSIKSDKLDVAVTGQVAFLHDLAQTLEHDLMRAELLSIPIAIIILLLVFRTVVASILPAFVGGLSVIGGIAVVMALSHVTEVAQYTINVCSLIGFGIAIDYSLFIVTRYREELAHGHGYEKSLCIAMNTAGRAVAFSGVAVGIGLGGLLFFNDSYLSVMGIAGAVVVLLAVVGALTLLPAILAILGPHINAGRLPWMSATRPQSRSWKTLATWVMHRPWAVLVPTLGILLLLASPALRLRVAASDVRMLPAKVDARRGFDELTGAFPDLAATRIAVVAKFPNGPVLSKERVGALYDLSHRMAKLPHVLHVESIVDRPADPDEEPPTREDIVDSLTQPNEMAAPLLEEAKRITTSKDATLLYVIADVPPESREAERLVKEIRRERTVLDGTILVAGQAARDVDATEFLVSHAPRAVAFVMLVTLVVMFILLRSVLLPFKAIAMNVLSIGACFGVLVWIFQDGHLFVSDGKPLDPTLPVLLFCTSFGLSMDYEVLMLVRMKEIYDRTGDNTEAVAEGLESTGGLVTSAAAIMVAVFAAFALARVVVLQATGVGLAVAVALDATLVRALLVPATMRLLGHLNWWAPSVFGKSQPHQPSAAE